MCGYSAELTFDFFYQKVGLVIAEVGLFASYFYQVDVLQLSLVAKALLPLVFKLIVPGLRKKANKIFSRSLFQTTYLCKIDVKLPGIWSVVFPLNLHAIPGNAQRLVHTAFRLKPDVAKVLFTQSDTQNVGVGDCPENFTNDRFCFKQIC